MADRREFVTTLTATVGMLAAGRIVGGVGAVTVVASTTIFQAHPHGQRTLVRFSAGGTDAAAGRLRVFDRRNRLVGTAGMLRRGESLEGELWLPLDGRATVRSELEMPGTRRPIRTRHVLEPLPRWTIHWFTAADPHLLESRLERRSDLTFGALLATLVAAGVRVNPVTIPDPAFPLGHLDLLRTAVPAKRITERFGVPTAGIALIADRAVPHLELALTGSGITSVVRHDDVGNPELLGFGDGRAVMARHIERWLAMEPTQPVAERSALIVGTDPDLALVAYATVNEWNARYAYPRIVIGDADDAVTGTRPPGSASNGSGLPVAVQLPAASVLAQISAARATRSAARTRDVFAPLARAAGATEPTLAGIAARIALPVSGVLVFNPSPFGRSDVARLPNGTSMVATDVPAFGYAYLPVDGRTGGQTDGDTDAGEVIENDSYRVTIDRSSGAIASVVVRGSGHDLVAAGTGLNAVAGARRVTHRRERVAGRYERLIVERRSPRGSIVTTISLHAGLPWIDIVNEATGTGSEPLQYGFGLAEPADRVEWEVAGGVLGGTPPIGRFTHLRWLAFRAAAGTTLFAAPDTGYAAVPQPDRFVAYAPTGRVRFRLAFETFIRADGLWRFGWSTEPLVAVHAEGRGSLALPTFGRMFELRDPGVTITGVKPADDGVGSILYIQEIMGVSRTVPFTPGILHFDRVVRTDFTERDLELLETDADGAALVPVTAHGFTALRVLGIRLTA